MAWTGTFNLYCLVRLSWLKHIYFVRKTVEFETNLAHARTVVDDESCDFIIHFESGKRSPNNFCILLSNVIEIFTCFSCVFHVFFMCLSRVLHVYFNVSYFHVYINVTRRDKNLQISNTMGLLVYKGLFIFLSLSNLASKIVLFYFFLIKLKLFKFDIWPWVHGITIWFNLIKDIKFILEY